MFFIYIQSTKQDYLQKNIIKSQLPIQQNYMLSEQSTSQKNYSFYSEPLPDNKMSSAEQVSFDIIHAIIQKTFIRIDKRQEFKENLKMFSKIKTIKNINEISSINFLASSQQNSYLVSSGQEPIALISDSFLPTSASIDKTNQYRNALKNMIEIQEEEEPTNKYKKKKQEGQQIYIKINELNTDQQDGYTKELRKIREQNKNKLQKDLKDKLFKERLQQQQKKNKDKKKQVEIKLSFDYNGGIIKQKIQSKTNLISKLINGGQNAKTLVNKQAINDPHPTRVEATLKTRKKNELNLSKRREEMYFNENRSLSEDVSVDVGVKYTFQGATLQKKQRAMSIIQLKKSMSTKKLSKLQFQKIKQINGSAFKQGAKTSPNTSNEKQETKQQRSKSQMHLGKRFSLPSSIIVINNESLKDKMLQTIVDNFSYRGPEQNKGPVVLKVSQSDVFNMNYLKTKNSEVLNEQESEVSTFVLPKISRKSLNYVPFPKERERIKENKNVIYEIRKQFEEKLKY